MRLARASIVVALLLCAGGAFAQEFTGTFFFGDSLTDAGTFGPFLPVEGAGKFTTNPGPVWAELFAERFGHAADPATQGGTNYAQGGARIHELPGVPSTNPLTAAAVPIATQIDTYLEAVGGHADPHAFYAVWGGANDLFVAQNLPVDQVPAYLATTAGQEVVAVGKLSAAGAKYILVPNLPDIGITPFGRSLGPAGAATVTSATSGYNLLLYRGLAAAGLRVIPADAFHLLQEVAANGARYGFTDVVHPACGAVNSLLCTSADLVAPNADKTYLFADGVHPTSGGHELIADYFYSIVAAPFKIGLLPQTAARNRTTYVRGLFDQLEHLTPEGKERRAWATATGFFADYGEARREGFPFQFAFGADGAFGESRVGVSAYLSQNEVSWNDNGGNYDITDIGVSAYGRFGHGPFKVSAIATMGTQSYNTLRFVELRSAVRKMKGEASGTNLSLGTQLGWEFESGALRHGPTGGLIWQQAEVMGFDEKYAAGEASTAMRFGTQTLRSAQGNLGWSARYTTGKGVEWFGDLLFLHEFKNKERDVTATLVSTAAPSFDMPLPEAKRNTGEAVIGAALPAGKSAKAFLVVGSTLGDKAERDTRVHLGITGTF